MCLCCCPVGHCVPHDTDMGRHPLKVDVMSQGGEVVEEVLDGEGEAMMGVRAVRLNELEGCE